MRHWIETGHEKTFWKVPTLLKIAMDVLDDHLDDNCCFHQALERGDIIFSNNAMIAHARDQFKNDPNAPPRHKVRAWIQVQKADILNEEKMASAYRHKSVSDDVSIICEKCVSTDKIFRTIFSRSDYPESRMASMPLTPSKQ